MYEGFYEDFQKACDYQPEKKERIPHWRDGLKGVNGNDPMSPYTLPESNPPIMNATELVNRKGFLAYYPQSYTPISNYFRDNNITPFFNPSEAEDESKGLLTIAGMVELLDTGQAFYICRDQDIVEIIMIAEAYLRTIGSLADRSAIAYSVKIEKLLNHLKSAEAKIARRHGKAPTIKQDIVEVLKRVFGGV